MGNFGQDDWPGWPGDGLVYGTGAAAVGSGDPVKAQKMAVTMVNFAAARMFDGTKF